MSTLSIDKISMRFDLPNGSHVQALKDISLEIKTGELMSVLGPSGCGKKRFSISSPDFWPRHKAR